MTNIEQAYRAGFIDSMALAGGDDKLFATWAEGWEQSLSNPKVAPPWTQVPPTEEGWYWARSEKTKITLAQKVMMVNGELQTDRVPLKWVSKSMWWQRIEEPEPPEGM